MNDKRVIVVGKVGNEWDGFMRGYRAAMQGTELADMQTQDERDGWQYAKRPKEAGGIIDNADSIRHGGN